MKDRHVDRVAKGSELLAVVELSMRVGRRCMRSYRHAKSPKVFTQPQLLACLILKVAGLTVTGDSRHRPTTSRPMPQTSRSRCVSRGRLTDRCSTQSGCSSNAFSAANPPCEEITDRESQNSNAMPRAYRRSAIPHRWLDPSRQLPHPTNNRRVPAPPPHSSRKKINCRPINPASNSPCKCKGFICVRHAWGGRTGAGAGGRAGGSHRDPARCATPASALTARQVV